MISYDDVRPFFTLGMTMLLHPLRVEDALFVHALVRMRTEVIALRLQQDVI